MPLRSQALKKRWSTVDLPIFPFLAPRVFQPWPWLCQSERSLFSTDRATQSSYTINRESYSSRLCDRQRDPQRGTTWTSSYYPAAGRQRPRLTSLSNNQAQYCHPRPSLDSFKPSQNLSNAHHLRSYHSVQYDGDGTNAQGAEEEFRRKYLETWDTEAPAFVTNIFRPHKSQEQAVQACQSRPRMFALHEAGQLHTGTKQRATTHIASLNYAQAKRASLRRRLHAHRQHEATRLKIPLQGSLAGTKLIRYVLRKGFHFAKSHNYWHSRFASINLRHQKFMWGRMNRRLFKLPKFRLPVEVEQHLTSETTATSLAEAWNDTTASDRGKIWPDLMLKTLAYYPNKALDVLSAVYTFPHPPSFAVGDSLDYIIFHHLRDQKGRSAGIATDLWQNIKDLMSNGPKGYIHISQTSIYLLLTSLDASGLSQLYETLDEFSHPFSSNTLMQFSSRLAKLGARYEALQLVKRLGAEGCNFDTPKMESLCTSVLQRKSTAIENDIADSEILGVFLQYGMKPNIVTYNVLLGNSLIANDPETAWQLHDMVVKDGVHVDAHTYSWLLNDAKLRMDVPTIQMVANLVKERNIRNAHIVTDLLHAVFLHRQRMPSTNTATLGYRRSFPSVFESVLQVYSEYFHLEPLAKLIPGFAEKYMHSTSSLSSSVAPEELMHPGAPTLVVMLTGYLREVTDAQVALVFYENFRNLISTGDAAVSELHKTTHVYNMVLKCFGGFPERLSDCPNVIADMLSLKTTSSSSTEHRHTNNLVEAESTAKDPSTTAEQGHNDLSHDQKSSMASSLNQSTLWLSLSASESNLLWRPLWPSSTPSPAVTSFRHPEPDIYTWSILLDIFISHRQPRAAEKILKMMTARGILPNQVTWNTLCLGYARMQDPAMMANTIERLEAAGYASDEVVLKGVELLRDKEQLIAWLRVNDMLPLKKRPAREGIVLTRLVRALEGKGAGVKKETNGESDEGSRGEMIDGAKESTKVSPYQEALAAKRRRRNESGLVRLILE